jgi:hypothetical protein
MLTQELILEAIDEIGRLQEIRHYDIRVTDELSLHLADSKVQFIPVAIELVRNEAIYHIGQSGLLVYQLIH